MSLMRRQAGVAGLVATSVALALLAAGCHAHSLPKAPSDDIAFDADSLSLSNSAVCAVCTPVHGSPASAVDAVGHPCFEQRLGPPDTVELPDEPVLCSHASRAPPASNDLGS